MRAAPARFCRLPGDLVSFPSGSHRLDGFWSHKGNNQPHLLVLVHGMGSDFHHSAFKKELMAQGSAAHCDVLSFNNRGSGAGVCTERFQDCLADLDAALAFGRHVGYRRFILAGHSTGCQKIAFYQSRRKRDDVEALVHLAPGDDYGILMRDMGARSLKRLVEQIHVLVEEGLGDEPVRFKGLSEMCESFTARRLLSIADPDQIEAGLFNYAGPMRLFSRLTLPSLVLFGDREEYACVPVEQMGEILRSKTASRFFQFTLISGADHGFHGKERETAAAVYSFIRKLGKKGRAG